jgi:hypothetical protein
LIVVVLLDVYQKAATLNAEDFIQIMRSGFPLLFSLFLLVIEGSYAFTIVAEISESRIRAGRTILGRVNLQTRALVTTGLRWTTVCLMILFLAVGASSQFNYFSDSLRSMIQQWLLPVYLLLIVCTSLSLILVNKWDWAVYDLEEFGRSHDLDSLQKALRDYNRVLGSTLSVKRLLTISQYVDEGFTIGSEKEKEDMTRQLHILTSSLKEHNVCAADRCLIDLSQSAEETVRRHKDVLGYEPKYPFRLMFWDTLKTSSRKVFPSLVLVLIWIAILMGLSYFGVRIPFPPTI